MVKYFAGLRLAIDCLHFKNHKDQWCKEVIFLKQSFLSMCNSKNMDPNVYADLKPVNTVICEQSFRSLNIFKNVYSKYYFSWSNHMKNVKAMNGPRFQHYWIYILGKKTLHYTLV